VINGSDLMLQIHTRYRRYDRLQAWNILANHVEVSGSSAHDHYSCVIAGVHDH